MKEVYIKEDSRQMWFDMGLFIQHLELNIWKYDVK